MRPLSRTTKRVIRTAQLSSDAGGGPGRGDACILSVGSSALAGNSYGRGPAFMRSCALLLLAVFAATGCKPGGESARWLQNGLVDPTQVGQFLEPKRNEIRASLSILEEPTGIQDAQEPRAEDLVVEYREHVIQPGDGLNISVFELLVPGQATNQQVLVSSSGYESLPTIGRVRMAGLTISGLELELKELLREAQILPDPEVQVSLLSTRTTRFSIIGSVSRPGSYELPQPDYRLLSALADAGGVPPQLQTIYVFRRGALEEPGPGEMGGGAAPQSQPTRSDIMEPTPFMLSDTASGPSSSPASGPAVSPWASTEPESMTPVSTQESKIDEIDILEGGPTTSPEAIIWDPEQGWIIKPAEDAASEPVIAEDMPNRDAPDVLTQELAQPVRIIEVPLKDLLAGDPRYNLVIRPYDLISVPPGSVGEYYMMGNVARTGAYDITGRRLTVKEAVAAAGGFGPLAWPSRADLVRRVSQDEEQIIQLDLDAIFAGTAPDFYLKPNDILNVGTTPAAVFLAVLRNAFRFSYGFGFVYDRNFADADTFQAKEQIRQRRTQEAALRGIPLQ